MDVRANDLVENRGQRIGGKYHIDSLTEWSWHDGSGSCKTSMS